MVTILPPLLVCGAALVVSCRLQAPPSRIKLMGGRPGVYLILDADSAWNRAPQPGQSWVQARINGASCLRCRVALTCDGHFLVTERDRTYPWGGLSPISRSTAREVRQIWQRFALPGNPRRVGPAPLAALLNFASANAMELEITPIRPRWARPLAELVRSAGVKATIPWPRPAGTTQPDYSDRAFLVTASENRDPIGPDPRELFFEMLQAGTEPAALLVSSTAVLDTLAPIRRPVSVRQPGELWPDKQPVPVVPPRRRLSSLLAAEFPLGRRHAENLVTLVGDPAAEPLIQLAKRLDVAPRARANAVWALAWLQGKAIVPVLLELTADPEPAVRAEACYALGIQQDDIAVPVLQAVLFDASRLESQAAAAWALGVLQDRGSEAPLGEYLARQLRRTGISDSTLAGAAAIQAALALGRLNLASSVPVLQQARMKTDCPELQRAARSALVAMPFDTSSQLLADALMQDELTLADARDVCQALARRATPTAIKGLARALSHRQAHVAAQAAWGLVAVGKQAVPAVREILRTHKDAAATGRALAVLGLLKSDAALPQTDRALAPVRAWARAQSRGWSRALPSGTAESPNAGAVPPLRADRLYSLRQSVGRLRETHLTVVSGRDVPSGTAEGTVAIRLSNPLSRGISGRMQVLGILGTWAVQPRELPVQLAPGESTTVSFKMVPKRPADRPRLPVIISFVNLDGTTVPVYADFRYAAQAVRASGQTIDGRLGDWTGAPLGRLGYRGQLIRTPLHQWRGVGDCSARFWAAYDDRRLYLAVAVRDDRVVRRQVNSDPGPSDQVELALVLNGRYYLVRVGPPAVNGDAMVSAPPQWRAGRDFRVEATVDQNGYQLEVSVSWAALGPRGTGRAPPRIGFDVAVHDVDLPGQWKSTLIWGGDGEARRRLPSTGTLILR